MSFGKDDEIGGKYRLEERLGAGGMGTVWRARHLGLGSPVAIKLMAPELSDSPSQRARFQREARSAAQLRSPHIVQVFDYGAQDETLYIVMELLEGEDLRTRLARLGRLSLVETAALAEQLAKGLQKAHDEGIIHRDLKPGNVFLAAIDDDHVVKILDFGIAKAPLDGEIGEEATTTGNVLGSPSYMSPEQTRGRDLDHRTDLWSFAVLLFRAVTGKLPFEGRTIPDFAVRLFSDPLPPPSTIAPHLPAALDAFFERALARDREQRFGSVRELVREFLAAAGVQKTLTSTSSLSIRMPTAPIPDAPPSARLGSGTLTDAGSVVTPKDRRPISLLGVGAAAFSVVLVAGMLMVTRSRLPTAAVALRGVAISLRSPIAVAVEPVPDGSAAPADEPTLVPPAPSAEPAAASATLKGRLPAPPTSSGPKRRAGRIDLGL